MIYINAIIFINIFNKINSLYDRQYKKNKSFSNSNIAKAFILTLELNIIIYLFKRNFIINFNKCLYIIEYLF